MLHIGLTGNVASGKTSVARLFAEWGATLIDADAIVHQLQCAGTPVYAAIVRRFGPEIVQPDGELDRAQLRRLVFQQPELRVALNTIVHPAVALERQRVVQEARLRGDHIVVSDIPLLFEYLDPRQFDAVVLVDAPAAVRRERLLRTRDIDLATADAMITAQMPAEAKRARSHYVIDNDADRDTLRRRAHDVWRALEKLAAHRA